MSIVRHCKCSCFTFGGILERRNNERIADEPAQLFEDRFQTHRRVSGVRGCFSPPGGFLVCRCLLFGGTLQQEHHGAAQLRLGGAKLYRLRVEGGFSIASHGEGVVDVIEDYENLQILKQHGSLMYVACATAVQDQMPVDGKAAEQIVTVDFLHKYIRLGESYNVLSDRLVASVCTKCCRYLHRKVFGKSHRFHDSMLF